MIVFYDLVTVSVYKYVIVPLSFINYSAKYCKSIPQSINGDLEIIIVIALYSSDEDKKVKTKPIDG